MIRDFISTYLPNYPSVLVYMLQSTEYDVPAYLKWVWRTKDFTSVMKRRQLEPTKPVRLLLLALRLGIIIQIMLGVWLIYLGLTDQLIGGIVYGAALVLIYPVLWAHLIIIPLVLGRWLISRPTAHKNIAASAKTFTGHQAVKIAVAGSYGKTTMKEILKTVLSEGLQTAATPANKNVAVSHAAFAKQLKGDEKVLIIEYGEGGPGDVGAFARVTQPTHAIITGLAPAHLDRYKNLAAAGEDIFSVGEYLKGKNVYVNDDSGATKPFVKSSYHTFNTQGALGWRVKDVKVSLEGISFTLQKGRQTIPLQSSLIGRHQIGFLALAAALGLKLGLTKTQVQAGVAKTAPFEHRMQPYELGGAWIVDDTYNGNLEGIRVGTALLKELPARRKIYVTPGLVDQGVANEAVHHEIGKLIAAAKPDVVVLMKNSVTDYIKAGLAKGQFKGELRIETDPLDFYSNLNHFVATGDLVVMQNDWTDNYA